MRFFNFDNTLFSLSLLIAVIFLLVEISQAQQHPQQIFQTGLYREEVEGDLEKAISCYQKIIDNYSGYRSLAANAWLHIGFCYEKLGKEKALDAYQKILREFQDQSEVVAIVKARVKNTSIRNAPKDATIDGRELTSDIRQSAHPFVQWYKDNFHFVDLRVHEKPAVIKVVIISDSRVLPTEWELRQNYPNPFDPATTIEYSLPIAANIELTIYDLQGRKVATLVNASQKAGFYYVKFNYRELPDSVYLYCIRSDRYKATKKMVIMR
ncbi:MAG TPA: T9SS type A sorting domain-containing protein [bacterium]